MSLAVVLALSLAAAPAAVKISGGTTVEVDGDRFHLLEGGKVVKASVTSSSRGERLVVDLIRIGDPVGSHEGEAPVLVTIAGTKNVLPNKPVLQDDRRVGGVSGMVASYPVRYYLDLPRRGALNIEISLRKKRPGERAGVKLSMIAGGGSSSPLAKADGRKRGGKKKGGSDPKDDAKDDAPADAGPATAAGAGAADAGPATMVAAAPRPGTPTTGELQADDGQAKGRLVITSKDAMGDMFKLRERRVTIDGKLVLAESAYGEDTLAKQQVAYDAELPVGRHDVQINLVYAGAGGGLFSYMEGYVFHVNDGRSVQTLSDQVTRVLFVAQEKGGIFTEIEDRPTVTTDVRIEAK